MENTNIEKEEKKLMTISHDDGSVEQVEVIVAFEFKDTKKEYVVYTRNERDDSGNITVYVSNVDRSTGTATLLGIEDENEWSRIKDVLRELSKED